MTQKQHFYIRFYCLEIDVIDFFMSLLFLVYTFFSVMLPTESLFSDDTF